MRNFLSLTKFKKQALVIAGALVSVAALIGVASNSVGAGDCTTNSIIKCGVTSASDLVNQARTDHAGGRANATGDLVPIYGNYGLTPDEYDRFIATARQGTAFTDGHIEVDSRTVATATKSLGRAVKPYSHVRMVGNVPFHESATTDVQRSNLPVLVMFTPKGDFEFAVLMACGNPIDGNPNNPVSNCNMLNVREANRDTRCFTANVTASNGSTVNRVEYNFGDGSAAVSKTNPGEEVCHTYTTAGNYTAAVRAVFNVPGNGTYVAEGGNCSKPITIATPPPVPAVVCNLLTVAPVNGSRTKFRFDAKATATNGATISAYHFYVYNTKDQPLNGKPVNTTAATASTEFDITTPGTYKGVVFVITSLGTVTGEPCTKPITVAPEPVAVCKLLRATTIDRTNFKLAASAEVSNGAGVQGYDFTVKNASGAVVKTATVNGNGLSTSTNVTIDTVGSYTAEVSVRTTVGVKTAATCKDNFTVSEKPVPAITIDKKVDGVEEKQVDVNGVFTYQIVVKNTGNTVLRNAVVTDAAPKGVTFIDAPQGTIENNSWKYVIPTIAIGESQTFTITAKIPNYVENRIVNTACVNAPEVNPENPNDADDCDDATVYVPPVTPPLPKTGAGSTLGIFAGLSVVGGIAHYFIRGRRFGDQ